MYKSSLHQTPLFPLIGRKRLAIADEVFVLKRRVLHKANMKRIVNCELMNCTEIRTVKFSLLNSEETSPSGKQNCSKEHVQRDMLIRCFSPRVCMFACLYNFYEPGVSEMNTWSGVSSPWSQPAYLDFSRNMTNPFWPTFYCPLTNPSRWIPLAIRQNPLTGVFSLIPFN